MAHNGRRYDPRKERNNQQVSDNVENNNNLTQDDEQEKILKDLSDALKEQPKSNEGDLQLPNLGTPINIKQPNLVDIAQQIQDDVQKNKAVYTVRKENGKVIVETEKKSTLIDHEVQFSKKLMIKQMIDDLDREILKTEIEIEVHRVIEQESKNIDEMNMNLRRIESFYKNVEYLKKKKEILLKL